MESSPGSGTKYARFFLQFRTIIRYRNVSQAKRQWEMESRYVWAITYHHADEGCFIVADTT